MPCLCLYLVRARGCGIAVVQGDNFAGSGNLVEERVHRIWHGEAGGVPDGNSYV